MKGTHCGRRAVTLVFSLISLCATVPAVANADVLGTAAPSTPTVPAAPAVPTPAVPAAPVSAPATTSAPAVAPIKVTTPVASITVASSKPAVTVLGHAKVKNIVKSPLLAPAIKPIAKPAYKVATAVATKSTTTVVKVASVKPVKKATSVVLKKARTLLNGGGGGSDDPMWGCKSGGWTTCQPEPIVNYPVNNRCVGSGVGSSDSGGTTDPTPVGTEDVIFPNATQWTWTKVQPFTKHIGPLDIPGMKVTVKTFIVGFNGVGTPSGATYRSVNDEVNTFTVFIPADTPLAQDIRHFTQLIVAGGKWNAGVTVPPSMWFSEHFVIRFAPTLEISHTWRIVCNKGDKAHDDDDKGCDHDRSGDHDKYNHNRHDYRGYDEDDSHESWDQDD
jgi:hypothetical protein